MTDKDATLVFIDWDDTVFPTSWVFDKNIELLDPQVRAKYSKTFRKLDTLIYNFLKKIERHGKIVIITNAMPEWVQLSGSLLRNTNKIIRRLPVLSAKQKYRTKTKNQKIWKTMCFDDTVKSYANRRKISNIVSIGDAIYEYDALVSLYKGQKGHRDRLLKAIQLTRYPSYHQLYEQLDIMHNNIDRICMHKDHLDIHFDDHKNSGSGKRTRQKRK